VDDAPANTQSAGEDDDLDRTGGVNNEVGPGNALAVLHMTPKPHRMQIKKLGI